MPLNTGFILQWRMGDATGKRSIFVGWGNVFRTYGEEAQRVFTAAFRTRARAAQRRRVYVGDVHYLRRITLSRSNTGVRSSPGKV